MTSIDLSKCEVGKNYLIQAKCLRACVLKYIGIRFNSIHVFENEKTKGICSYKKNGQDALWDKKDFSIISILPAEERIRIDMEAKELENIIRKAREHYFKTCLGGIRDYEGLSNAIIQALKEAAK